MVVWEEYMVEITTKCKDYEIEAQKARTLIALKKLIMIAPAILLVALGIALTVVCDNFALLIISALGIIYVPIILLVLKNIFDGLVKTIKQKYVDFYAITNNEMQTAIKKDNKGYSSLIGTNNVLYCRCENGLMKYVSSSFVSEQLSYKEMSVQKFAQFLKLDFGELVIPVDDIDHYRENEIVCTYGEQVFRIEFADNKTMDAYIPKKEFYYQSSKKD